MCICVGICCNYLDILCIYILVGQSPKALNQKCIAVFNQRLAVTTTLPTNQQPAGRKFIKHIQLKKKK